MPNEKFKMNHPPDESNTGPVEALFRISDFEFRASAAGGRRRSPQVARNPERLASRDRRPLNAGSALNFQRTTLVPTVVSAQCFWLFRPDQTITFVPRIPNLLFIARPAAATQARYTALIRTVRRDPYAVTPLVSVCRWPVYLQKHCRSFRRNT